MTPAQAEWGDLLDLHDYLTARGLRITRTHIIEELNGKLWIEATTKRVTTTASDGVADNKGEASSQPHQERQG